MKRTIFSELAPIMLCLLLFSLLSACEEKRSPETLLADTMEEVNKTGNGYDDFKIYHNNSYYAIIYQLKNTPENKAKLLWLGNHEELGDKFRAEIIKNLEQGEILARVVKEKKDLVLAVGTDDIEYHTVFTPEEIAEKIFKK